MTKRLYSYKIRSSIGSHILGQKYCVSKAYLREVLAQEFPYVKKSRDILIWRHMREPEPTFQPLGE